MHRTSTILPFLLLAFVISLSSCVNEVKNPPKAQDSLARLVINYNIPDSNNILAVDFNALITPAWKPQYRIDWNFGDSTGLISKFDTSILPHYYKKFGSYLVTLSVVDTVTKAIVGRTSASIVLDSINQLIDTNYLHQFTKMDLFFSARCICPARTDSIEILKYTNLPIEWQGRRCKISQSYYGNLAGKVDISANGLNIDSSSLDDISSSWRAVGYHGIITSIFIKSLKFKSPINFKNADSMLFSSSRKNLSSNIVSLVDSTFDIYGTMIGGYSGQVPTKKFVLLDGQPLPVLTVKFYK